MAEHLYPVGKTVTLSCTLTDNNTPANNPVTGETVTVSLRRFSDDKWWDFVAGEWDTVAFGSLASEHKQALADKSDGSYEVDWDQATNDASAERQYLAYYKVTSAGDFLNRVQTDVLTFDDIATLAGITADHGAGTYSGAAGTGANTVTVTVQTAGAVTYAGVKVSITNQAETTAALVQYTNSSGQAVFYLDAGDWRAVGAQTAAQSGGATNFTVDGAEAVTVTVTAAALPAPADPSNYILYGYARKLEADAAFGASGVTVKVIAITSTGQYDATANATRHIMGTSYATDSAGLWSIEIAQALVGCRLRLEFTWTDSGSLTQTEEWEATITAPASGSQLAWADLSPTKKA